MKLIFLLFLICLVNYSKQKSTSQDDNYVAAVLEYQFAWTTAANLQNYINYIQEAAAQDADIVVFPEMTLAISQSVVVPMHGAVKHHPVPADNATLYDEVLVALSAAAIQYQVYVVVNLEEKMDCITDSDGELCPERKLYLFNTNVVFDRNGAIIDRFRKINLFGEASRTSALSPDLGVFTTDFGVTFGHFICFDLQFQVPAIQVVEQLNITDVIFSTMWFSELPYLTGVQIQEAYSYTMNINLLASGANSVRAGSAGSGIFSGKAGALISTMPGRTVSRLLVSKVPKVPGRLNGTYPGPIVDPPSDADGLRMLQDPSLKAHTTRLLVPGYQDFVLKQNDVSCWFKIRMRQRNGDTHYVYRASVFDGVRTFSGVASGGTRLCSIMSCTDDEIDSCGMRFETYTENTTAIFEELTIEATVPTPRTDPDVKARDSIYFPVSVDVSTLPLRPEHFTYSEEANAEKTVYKMSLTNTNAEIYTFAVWGRRFITDGEDPTPARDSSDSLGLSTVLVAGSIVLYVYFTNVRYRE